MNIETWLLITTANLVILAINVVVTALGIKLYTEYAKDKFQDKRVK